MVLGLFLDASQYNKESKKTGKCNFACIEFDANELLIYPDEETISPYREAVLWNYFRKIPPASNIKVFLSTFDCNWRALEAEFDALFNVSPERYLTPTESVYNRENPLENKDIKRERKRKTFFKN